MYLQGEVPKGKPTYGLELLEQAISASTGETKAYAQYVLGAAYYYSDEIRDKNKAVELLTQSADSGNEHAVSLLERIDSDSRVNIANLMHSTMLLLQNAESSTDHALQDMSARVFGRGDLSKEAIAELIYKLQDKQNIAEM